MAEPRFRSVPARAQGRSSEAEPSGGRPAHRGLWFEDFRAGDVFASAARTVTEADVAAFAGLSGDFNPLHTDEVFAARSPFRSRIAHGLLVESIASGLAAQIGLFDGTIAALAEVAVRFEGPVRAGDTLRVELAVVEVDPQPTRNRGRVRFEKTVWNQRGERVSSGTWETVLLRDRRRRDALASGSETECT